MFCFGLNHMKHCVISMFSLVSHRKRLKCLSMSVSCNCWLSEYIQLGSTLTADLSLQKHATSLSSCAAWHHPHGVCGTTFHFFLELVMLEIYAQSKQKNVGVFLTIRSLFKCTIIIWCISSFLSGQLSMRARLPYWIWDIGDQSKHSSVTQCDYDGVYLHLNLLNFNRKL